MEAPVTTAAAMPETMRSSDVNQTNNNKSVEPEQFSVDEFLDLSNDDDDELFFSDNTYLTELQNLKADPIVTPLSSVGGLMKSNSTDELDIPYDDAAELELVWRIEEEKFPSEDMEKLRFISGKSTRPENAATVTHESQPDPNSTKSHPEIPVPAKTRTKRPRPTSGNWPSPLLFISESDDPNPVKKQKPARKYGPDCLPVDGRKCQHCQTDKTPQWRTGPMGPKTLCNACGVRFKTGRLVPEYRPASSPTFVQTKHSNSHRKVMELRRQKESMMMMGILPQQNQRFLDQYRDILFDGSNGDDFFDHPLIEPDFGQLI